VSGPARTQLTPAKRAVTSIGLLLAGALFFAVQHPIPAAVSSEQSAQATMVGPGDGKECPPTNLAIPDLAVNAAVVPVGVERDGTLGTPSDADKDKAGWYPSVLLGSDHGTLVLVAHTYHDNSAVLKTNFKQGARVGMSIQLQCADGRSQSYTASEVKVDLTLQTYPTFVQSRGLYASDGPAQLILVTCTDWNPARRDWDQRAIVIASPTP